MASITFTCCCGNFWRSSRLCSQKPPAKPRASRRERKSGTVASMRRKHSLKELRLRCKNSHHAFLGPSPILHRKQRTRHQNRPPPQSRMSRFVLREVFMSDRFGQRLSLQKGQAHAFTGNGIDSSGRVANQRGVSACHSRQNKIPSHRSALGCRRLAVHKSRGDIGKKRQRITEPQFRISRKHHDANFVRGNGSYIQLRFFSPMDFDAIRPRRASKMLPKRKTHARRFSRFKSRPVAYQRTQSVRANNPVRREIPAAGADEILSNSSHHCSPQNHGARKFRRANQLAVQFDSPHALSLGASPPSATVTCNPLRRSAIAATRPAGPPPITNACSDRFMQWPGAAGFLVSVWSALNRLKNAQKGCKKNYGGDNFFTFAADNERFCRFWR